jgi:hypothetical protein
MPDDTQRLLDELRIRRLAEQYARAVDSLDLALLETCFVDEVDADYSEVSGMPAVRLPRHAFASGLLRGMAGFDATQHLIGTVAVAFADASENAKCEAYVHATHVLDDRLWTVGGMYTHEVRLTPGGWRIESLHLAGRWQTGDPEIRDLAMARGRAGEGSRRVRRT